MDYFLEHTGGDVSIIVEISKLKEKFVDTKEMSKPTLYAGLNKLIEEKIIQNQNEGMYTLLQIGKQP
jgi:hypothetical protein